MINLLKTGTITTVQVRHGLNVECKVLAWNPIKRLGRVEVDGVEYHVCKNWDTGREDSIMMFDGDADKYHALHLEA